MATWGDFIKEVPIVNKRSEGIFVKADHVLDLWEERNKLRRELAQARQGGSAGASPEELRQAADAEREACAREIEEMAEALAGEDEPNPQMIALLEAVARLLREKASGDAEESAPMAEPMNEVIEDAPMAEPMEVEEIVLTAEAMQALATPPAEVPSASAEPATPAPGSLAELLQRMPPRPS